LLIVDRPRTVGHQFIGVSRQETLLDREA